MASKKLKKSPAKPSKISKPGKGAAAQKKPLSKVTAKVVQKVSAILSSKKKVPVAPVKAVAPAKAVKGKVAAPQKSGKPVKPIVAPTISKKSKVVAPVANAKASKIIAKAAPVEPAPGKGKKGKVVAVEVSVSPAQVKGKAGKLVVGKAAGKAAKKADALSLKKRCREPGCDNDPLIGTFCRLHYIKNWKKIKRKEAIIAAGQLNSYVEELVNKYPDKYLDVIRQDLASEKDWAKVVTDLELDSVDDDHLGDEEAESATEGGRRSSERDFDDDSDSF